MSFSDSYEDDSNDNATFVAAHQLEKVVSVFMGVGIGAPGDMNMENLTSLLGNKTEYAFESIQDANNATFGVGAEIAYAYACPKIACKVVLFVEEMTEIVGHNDKLQVSIFQCFYKYLSSCKPRLTLLRIYIRRIRTHNSRYYFTIILLLTMTKWSMTVLLIEQNPLY